MSTPTQPELAEITHGTSEVVSNQVCLTPFELFVGAFLVIGFTILFAGGFVAWRRNEES